MPLHGASYDYHLSDEEPEKPAHHGNRAFEFLLLVILSVALVFAVVPSLRLRVMSAFSPPKAITAQPGVVVWAVQSAGSYYCSGDRFYGHGPGIFLKQGDALTLGYQPDLGKYCDSGQTTDSKSLDRRQDPPAHPGVTPGNTDSNHATSLPTRPK